ncbi:hypothetical protein KJ359_008608 [Pestalotiopsis sp. 9143b]|nr:hypothetical protein KJ359_008608 [Pestalotiopsis sp. 9143b]
MGGNPSKPHIVPPPAQQVEVVTTAHFAPTLSPTSNVTGKHFDHVVQIFIGGPEGPKYPTLEASLKDPNLQYLASQGVLLTNYHGVAHPLELNYAALVSGWNHTIGPTPAKDPSYNYGPDERTIVDLLEAKGVSWSTYSEGLPYTGFLGDWHDTVDGSPMYEAKYNPLMHFKSVTQNPTRVSKMKNFTMFDEDMARDKLPQWSFVTPNNLHSAHYIAEDKIPADFITTMGLWARGWLEPVLANTHFNTNRTLILLTSDNQKETHKIQEPSYAVMLGGVMAERKGQKDDREYNHYSLLTTVEDNWRLGNLGKDDADPTRAPLLPVMEW